MRFLAECIHADPGAQRFIHDVLPFARWLGQKFHQLVCGLPIEILCKAKAVPARFQRPDCLLQGFLVCLADAHCLADCTHLCAKFVLGILKFFKGPPGKLDHHIVT